MFRALFLDLDQTLCDTNKADIQARVIVEKLFIQESYHLSSKITDLFFLGIYRNLKEQYHNLYPENFSNEYEYRTQLLKKILSLTQNPTDGQRIDFLVQEIQKYRIQYLDFFPKTLELIKNLRKDYILAVITNGPLYSQEVKIQQLQLANYVDHIFIGGNYPEQKPHPSIFELVLKTTKCQTNEVIHIGDSLTADIWGAFNSNLKSIWINPKKQELPKELNENTWQVENFLKVPKTLKLIEKKL